MLKTILSHLKIMVLIQATLQVSNGNNISNCASPIILCTLLLVILKANKLPLETVPVSHDNNMVLMLILVNKLLLCLTQLITV